MEGIGYVQDNNNNPSVDSIVMMIISDLMISTGA